MKAGFGGCATAREGKRVFDKMTLVEVSLLSTVFKSEVRLSLLSSTSNISGLLFPFPCEFLFKK